MAEAATEAVDMVSSEDSRTGRLLCDRCGVAMSGVWGLGFINGELAIFCRPCNDDRHLRASGNPKILGRAR